MLTSSAKILPNYRSINISFVIPKREFYFGNFAVVASTIQPNIQELRYNNYLRLYNHEKRAIERQIDEMNVNGVFLKNEIKAMKQNAIDKMFVRASNSSKKFNGAGAIRARNKVRDLIVLNQSRNMIFLTLTYENEPASFEQSLKDIQNWERRINRRTKKECFFVAVPELGEENERLHWHIVLSGKLPQYKWLENYAWLRGFTKVQRIKPKKGFSKVDCVSNYICKYITKDCREIAGRKRFYYASHNAKTEIKKAYFSYDTSLKILEEVRRLVNNPKNIKEFRRDFEVGQTDVCLIRMELKNISYEVLKGAFEKFEVKPMYWSINANDKKVIACKELQKNLYKFVKAVNAGKNTEEFEKVIKKYGGVYYKNYEHDILIDGLRCLARDFLCVPSIDYFNDFDLLCDFFDNPQRYLWNKNACYHMGVYRVKSECF